MLSPQASGYDLGKHMMLQSHVVILVAFEGWTLVTRTLLLFPRIDGNGTLQKDYGSAKWIPFIPHHIAYLPKPVDSHSQTNPSLKATLLEPWQALCRRFISKSRHIEVRQFPIFENINIGISILLSVQLDPTQQWRLSGGNSEPSFFLTLKVKWVRWQPNQL